MTRWSLPALLGLLLLFAKPARPVGPPPAAPDFDRDVAPLLARRCLECHSGDDPAGGLDLSRRKSALTMIEPGRPDESPLWQKVRDGEMPPKKALTAAEKAVLRRWVAAGARWGGDPIDPFRFTTDSRAGHDFWSLQPVRRVAPPAAQDTSWARNSIDRFILARLEAKGLAPSPEADRRTLIRRVTFDLTGLPPSPEDVDHFLSDKSPDAYERLIDRLLASPHHGERWGRHWLDVARYGESDGFERDLPRPNAWPYRDWVVGALNADLPYADFARLQLAGDALRPGDAQALAATGFLVAGPHDIVLPASEPMRASMRQDELEDIVSTVGQTFLGLTVHCSRCHDHKFDPLPQADYYRLASALAGVRHGERPWVNEEDTRDLKRGQSALAALQAKLAAAEAPARKALLAEYARGKRPAPPKALAEWDFTAGLDDRIGELHAKARGAATRTAEGLRLDGKTGFAVTAPLKADLGAKTLEAWVTLDGLTQRGGGIISAQSGDGHRFDAIVYGEREAGRWMAGSEGFARTRPLGGPAEKEEKRIVHLAISYGADGTVAAYRDGRPYGKPYRAEAPLRLRGGDAVIVFGLRHGTAAGGNRMLAGTIRRARLYDRALSASEVARSAGLPSFGPDDIRPLLLAEARADYDRLLKEREARFSAIGALQRRISNRRLYVVSPEQPAVTRLLRRGSVAAPGEVIAPEVPVTLARRLAPTRLKANAPEAERRLGLAKWVTDPDNPLFARVIVNRLWHHHFGTGLVDTPSDLGFNGGRPSHPELLDWLADELLRQNGSLKAIHRLLVTSATYRQASRHRPDAARVDAGNRLLWRRSPARLEAEAVRDAMLAVSGELDRQVGGPPYLDFRSYFFKGTQFYDPLEQVGPAFARRSLYRMAARGGRSALLDTFDCPDPSTPTPRRAMTTTPLQALALFNNAAVFHQAERLAARVKGESGDVRAQVRRAYQLAYGRGPRAEEEKVVVPFVRKHGLAALGRVLFNTSEFVQVE